VNLTTKEKMLLAARFAPLVATLGLFVYLAIKTDPLTAVVLTVVIAGGCAVTVWSLLSDSDIELFSAQERNRRS
jgi:hypothetical protein